MPLNFKQSGLGEPIILIHGLFGSLENLGAIARLLAEEYTVMALDLPNHGRSLHTDSIDLASMCDYVVQWMDQHQVERAHFLGHSLGGKVSMELALRYPERVDKLVIIDIAPVHYPPHHDEVFAGLLSFDPNSLSSRKEAEEHMREYVSESPVRSFLLKNLVRREDGSFSWRMNLPVIHEGYQNLVKGNREEGRFEGNTLFLKGGHSDYIQEVHREEILSRFPKASLKVVANTGHWLHAEKPDIVAKLVKNFINKGEEQ